jgi:hypothetical protein
MCLSTAIAAAKIEDHVRECFASLHDDVVVRTCCGGAVGRMCRNVDW